MSADLKPDQPASVKHVKEHLANERTYLAWLRTSFSLLTLGFATNKFGQFMVELRSKSGQLVDPSHGTRRFGIGMAVMGILLILYSTWNFNKNKKAIQLETFQPNTSLIWVVGIASFAFGLASLGLLLNDF